MIDRRVTFGRVAIGGAVIIISLLCLLPFWLTVSGSFTAESQIIQEGFSLWPREFSTLAYEYLFANSGSILSGYRVSIFVTAFGTAFSLLVTALMAYPLSRRDMKYRNHLTFFAFFTMLFHGGMVPWYIVTTQILGLRDVIWALIFPYSIQAWNMILLRNFFRSIPSELIESAKIDGAHEFTIFARIAAPLSVPGLATIGLFIALLYWNDWWLGLMLINDQDLYPLQLLLRRIVSAVQFLQSAPAGADTSGIVLPSEGVKMATAIVTLGPIVLVYPFVQRYFVKGIMIGAVKG
ncbi:MAG: carbohydrate ABC transporter permease [Spirochaetales bacterium]